MTRNQICIHRTRPAVARRWCWSGRGAFLRSVFLSIFHLWQKANWFKKEEENVRPYKGRRSVSLFFQIILNAGIQNNCAVVDASFCWLSFRTHGLDSDVCCVNFLYCFAFRCFRFYVFSSQESFSRIILCCCVSRDGSMSKSGSGWKTKAACMVVVPYGSRYCILHSRNKKIL